MRILYLHPDSWTGEYPVLARLRDLGHEIFVLEERRGLASGKRQVADHFRVPGDGIATLWYDPRLGWERLVTWLLDRVFRRAFDGRNLVHRMWVIAQAVRRFRPDAVICSDGFSYAVPAAFLRRAGLLRPRLIIGYIGGDILDDAEAEYGRRRTPGVTRLIRASLRAADVLRPVSPLLAAVLARDGAPADRVHVCPSHLVAPAEVLERVRARRGTLRSEIRRRYSLPDDAPLVVTLSMNQKGKGLHLLARAWPRVAQAVPGIRWLLCGPAHEWLDAAVWPPLRQGAAADSVVATGPLAGESVFEHLAAADLNVNPTLCEGLNMVVVEAAAVGTPSVTSDAAGVADWVRRYRAGAVFPRGDSRALADAIISAFRERDALRQWSSAAVAMTSDFRLDRVAAALLDLMSDPRAPALQRRRSDA
jgi:glycosyltransferase involved in cell wall biosynthesis